jgi:hypothetical protein
MKDFSNGDFDRFRSYCRRILGSRECVDSKAQDGERKRLIWRIATDAKTAGLGAEYLRTISTDLYGLACWEQLSLGDLRKLRDTIHNRASRHMGKDTRTTVKKYILHRRPTAPVPQELQPF